MPNDTTNRLTLRGSNAEVARFTDENKGGEGEALSLEALLPTPPEMLESNAIKDGKMPEWYNWRVENWGTKWDAYDCHEWLSVMPKDAPNWLHLNWSMGEVRNVLGFYTAWSPPTPWLVAVSEKYELEFMLEYADEGGGFVGYSIVSNGWVTKEVDFPWDSLDGKELRDSLGYGDYEEVE